VIPFTVTDQVTQPEVVPLPDSVFKPNYKWDLSEQNQGTVTVNGVQALKGVASLPGGGTSAVVFYDRFTDIDLTITAKENKAASAATGGRTDILFEFENGKNVSFGIVKWDAKSSCIIETLGNSTNHIPASRKNTLYTLNETETNAYLTDGVELRVVRSGTDVYVFVEGKYVAVFDLTQNNSGVTADMKATVSLRHYDAIADQVDIPFTVADEITKVTITDQSVAGKVVAARDTYVVGTEVLLTAEAEGYNLMSFKVDGEAVQVNADGTYRFIATKSSYTVEGTFRKAIFEAGFDTALWDVSGQYDGYVKVIGGGGATDKPLQFAGTYQNVDLTLNARDYADSTTASRTEFGFEFDVDGDGVIDTSKGDQTVTFGIAEGNRVQTRGGTLLSWKTPYDLTAEEKAQLVITAEEIAAGNEDGLDLRLIRYGTTIYIFVEDRQVAICDLTKCANSAGDTASGITADTKMFIYLRHYDDKRTAGVDIPFSISTDVSPVEFSVTSNDTGTVAVNKVNYYVNNGRTSKPSETHFKGEKITLTLTPDSAEHIVNELLVNTKDVTGDITANANGTYEYILNVMEDAYAVSAEFNVPVFKDSYDTALWDISGQYDGVVVLPNGGGATAKPLEFNKKYGNIDLTLTVRDYPNGEGEEDARTDVEYIFDNGETVTFGVVKTGGLYRIQTRGGTLLSWKTPYYITNQTLIDAYVVTAEELSSGDPGGLDFRVIRYGTEFYLYLNGIMVKGYDFSYKIAADTHVAVKLRHYDDAGQRVEIPFKVTEDVTISNPRLFSNKAAVTNYAYSFAVIPDTQIVAENDVKNGETNLAKLFDWIVTNKSSKNIQYVFGLGDITQNNNAAEWTLAQAQFAKLSAAGIPYSAIRGNHDLSWYGKEQGSANYYTDDYTAYIGTAAYRAQFEGFYSESNVSNSWRTFVVGEVKYLMLTLDYGADDDVLNWASSIIEQHPYHNVIITTHAYLYRDGTTLDAGDNVPPSANGGTNNGDDMWNKLVSKHNNIVLVMCGHDPSESIVVNRSTGKDNQVVTSMLIDAQDVEAQEGSMGMVAMLYFSADGKNLQVEYYSTAKEKYFMTSNQFSAELDMADAEPFVYGTGHTPIAGKQLISDAYSAFPRTIEVTFSTSDVSTRSILWGNCDGKTKDFINLELEKTSGLVYLNMTLGGTTYRHSFTNAQKEITATGQPVRLTLVMEDTAIKLYVNGALAQTRTVSNGGDSNKPMDALWASAAQATLPANWAIGDDLRGLYTLKGTIYDVAVWSDVRTAEEVAGSSIENIGTAGYNDHLLAAYNFWAGYKYTEKAFGKDLSGNGNDLTGTLNVATSSTKLNIDVEAMVYGTGYVPVSGQQVKTTSSFASFPRTIEVTFNRSSKSGRMILLGNCGGSSNDYFNLECPNNENIIYLNLCLGGVTYQHSFNTISYTTGQTVRVTVVIEDAAVKCYVNGELAQTRTVTNSGNQSKTMEALWGSVPKANLSNLWGIGNDLRTYPFNGTIYDIALWSDVRTAEEISGSSIASLGTAGYNDNLLAAYNFCEGYKISKANFSQDLSGNGNQLTGTLNVTTSDTPFTIALAAVVMGDLLEDSESTPDNGESTPPADDTGDAEGTPPADDTGDAEGTPPADDTGDAEGTPPADDTGDAESTPPADDTGDAEGTPPADDTGDAEGTPPADDTGDAESTPPADDTGDAEGTPPADDTGDAEGTPPSDDSGSEE